MGPETYPSGQLTWPLMNRILFRFFFVYFILYILPFPVSPGLSLIGEVLSRLNLETWAQNLSQWTYKNVLGNYQQLWDQAVVWVGEKVFNTSITIRPGGSGDTTWNYVQIFCYAVIAVAVALLWSIVDFRRKRYTWMHAFLRTYVRYYVGWYMIVYGAMKVIKAQFPSPDTDRLLMTFGESSPMRLLWTFMGASEGYNWFTGGGEMLGGLLLCFRRTTLLGALVTFGVMLHVSALNFCYDVPVKLFSSHLVLMAIFLMVPSMGWMFQSFVLARRTECPGIGALTSRRWVNVTVALLNLFVVGMTVFIQLRNSHNSRTAYGDLSKRPPLYGLWDVEEFTMAESERPPLLDDAERWRYVTFTRKMGPDSMVMIETMTGTRQYYKVEVDETNNTITLSKPSRVRPGTTSRISDSPIVLNFKKSQPDLVEIEGVFQLPIRAKIRRADESQFLLLNRGFNWINEMPYNATVPRKPKSTSSSS